MNSLQKQLAQLSPEELAQIYKNVFDTAAGKLVIEDLRQRCFFYTPSFALDSHQTAFNEGSRAALQRIEALVDSNPEDYATPQNED